MAQFRQTLADGGIGGRGSVSLATGAGDRDGHVAILRFDREAVANTARAVQFDFEFHNEAKRSAGQCCAVERSEVEWKVGGWLSGGRASRRS